MSKISRSSEKKIKKRWEDVITAIEGTKGLDTDSVLIVPREDWNPTILSKERNRLVTAIKDENPKSISELANLLDRKRENVCHDLKILKHYGIIELKKDGKRTIPIKKAQEIVLVG